jgi:hypothetical protein
MTAKQFFKSTAFKCIVVLLAIVIICSIFLTLANALLYVSDEEKFDRAIAKIYGESVETTEIDLSNEKTSYTYSTINSAYKVDDGNYLINVSGKQGHGGDITCWVVVKMSSDGKAITGIYKVVLDSVPSGEFTSKLSSSTYDVFINDYEDGIVYDYGFKNDTSSSKGDGYISTGASESMRAISNAVNGALDFVKAYALGVVNLGYYEAHLFQNLDYINEDTSLTYYSVEDGVVTYNITTLGNAPAGAFTIKVVVGSDKTITSYEVVTNGSTYAPNGYYFGDAMIDPSTLVGLGSFDGVDLKTGATRSNEILVSIAKFATSNYQTCIDNPSLDTAWLEANGGN